MRLDLARNESPLIIAVKNSDGQLVPIQGLEQFLFGNRDLRILCMLRGQELFDILYDDHGLIRYERIMITGGETADENKNSHNSEEVVRKSGRGDGT